MLASSDNIVITGCGWVTPFGAGNIPRIVESAAAAHSGGESSPIPRRIPKEVLDECGGIPADATREELVHLAACALRLAMIDSNFENSTPSRERMGVVFGCALAGVGGMIDFAEDVRAQSARFVSPLRFPQTVGNYLAGAISRSFHLRGPNFTLAAPGAFAGLAAVIEAKSLLHAGKADSVFAGGVDRVPQSLRKGTIESDTVAGDGACILVLEREHAARARGVKRWARFVEMSEVPKPAEMAEIRSLAGGTAPGAIQIEKWVGQCSAALGASAVAAGIAALHGFAVPIHEPTSPSGFRVHRWGSQKETPKRMMVRDPDFPSSYLVLSVGS